jgi:CDP-diacylglycerol--glycerol-3-phosphate 3-phosphatidyltransferase
MPRLTAHDLNVPNVLSILRIGLAPTLLALACFGQATAFLVALVAAFATDALDGAIARATGRTSELGARLDSLGDLLVWLVLPLCTWWLRPEFVTAALPWLLGLGAALVLPLVIGVLKFRRLTSYHTIGAKVSCVVLAAALISLYAGGPTWPFAVAALVALASQVEEILITLTLPRWRADVLSLRHARALR